MQVIARLERTRFDDGLTDPTLPTCWLALYQNRGIVVQRPAGSVGNTKRLNTVECVRLKTERVKDPCRILNSFLFCR